MKRARTQPPAASDEGLAARVVTSEPTTGRDLFYTSADGLKLHIREYGDPLSPWLPVVCLPGLTRSARDFHALATHLSTHRHRPRRVAVFDYRGRGQSAWDRDPVGYNPLTEMTDVFDGMAMLGIPRGIVVGTSRGGIIGMLMGVARPATLAGLVLNDIGPAIEARGLARIKSYIGRTPTPDDWADAAHIQRRLHGRQFTGWNDADWDHFARLTYREEEGRPAQDYDPKLADTFAGVEFDRPVPTMWDEFRALRDIPVLVLHGENSDLLSSATVKQMMTEHPAVEAVTIPEEGHPPLLKQGNLLARVSAFITATEGAGPPQDGRASRPAQPFNLDGGSQSDPA